MHCNDICKPLALVAGKVLARVFLNHLTDCITKVFIQTVFFIWNTQCGNNYVVYLAPSPIIKVSNKIVYVVVVDLLKKSTPCEDRDCWRRCGNMIS